MGRNGKRNVMVFFLVWFLLLVVLPVSGIFLLLKARYQRILVDHYIDYIVQKEKNISDALLAEVQDSTRLLASMCLVNNSEVLNLASEMNRSESNVERFELSRQLKDKLNYTFLHRSEIGSIVLFFDRLGTYYYRSGTTEGEGEARASMWYQSGMRHQGRVHVTGILKDSVSKSGGRYAINLVFSMRDRPPQNQVELVRLSYFTHAMDKGKTLDGKGDRGTMLIADGLGNIMMSDRKEWEGLSVADIPCLARAAAGVGAGVDAGAGNSYRAVLDGNRVLITAYEANLPGLQWRIYNLSDYSLIVKEFHDVSSLFFAIIGTVLLLFTGFAVIFFKRASLQEQEKIQIEMEALQSQINPHFISNTLNAIRFMAIVAKFESIEKMAEALIKILGVTFARGDEIMVGEELDMIRKYVYLMQIRYGGKFSAEFDIAEGIMDCRILKLVLQPVLENAVIHGFEGREHDCRIVIKGYEKEGVLIFEIIDNGNGMGEEQVKTIMEAKTGAPQGMFGIGMVNIRRRIVLRYGKKYGMRVESETDRYTRVVLALPVIRAMA